MDLINGTCFYFAEQARTPIGVSPVIGLIVSLEELNSQRKPHVDIQAMRALANACVDHGKNQQDLRALRSKVYEEKEGSAILTLFVLYTRRGQPLDSLERKCV